MGKAKKTLLWVTISLLTLCLMGCAPEAEVPEETQPPVKQGLTTENGATCYYNEDGSLFTGGLKEVAADGITHYYYFQEDGRAFTGGLKLIPFEAASHYYYFREDGSALTSGWETADGVTYYFQANGQAAQSCFVTIEDKLYYFVEDGSVAADGWFCVGDGYYYADDTGALKTETVFEGYKLDAAGKSATKYRIRQYVSEHTTDAMTDQEKIKALYNWVLENDMSYIRSFEHAKADWVWQDSWVDDMAASQMDNWGGNCYRYAAFLGLLIHEATGLPVNVYRGQTPGVTVDLTFHGWAEVYQDGDWYIYDVELLKFTEYTREGCYQMLASESTLHIDGTPTPLYSGELPSNGQ